MVVCELKWLQNPCSLLQPSQHSWGLALHNHSCTVWQLNTDYCKKSWFYHWPLHKHDWEGFSTILSTLPWTNVQPIPDPSMAQENAVASCNIGAIHQDQNLHMHGLTLLLHSWESSFCTKFLIPCACTFLPCSLIGLCSPLVLLNKPGHFRNKRPVSFPIVELVLKSTTHFRVQVREQTVKWEDFKRSFWGNVKGKARKYDRHEHSTLQ